MRDMILFRLQWQRSTSRDSYLKLEAIDVGVAPRSADKHGTMLILSDRVTSCCDSQSVLPVLLLLPAGGEPVTTGEWNSQPQGER